MEYEKKISMRIYISGPITGHDDYMKTFQAAEDRLREEGHEVLNPARSINDLMQSIGWEPSYNAILAMDLCMMRDCDAIYMLKGYESSNGTRTERAMAVKYGLELMYEEMLP